MHSLQSPNLGTHQPGEECIMLVSLPCAGKRWVCGERYVYTGGVTSP